MFRRIFYILIIFLTVNAYSKTDSENIISGSVSYISSQNIYVKFENTEGIEIGDTLFIKEKNKFIPAVKVDHKSSTSCAGTPFTDKKIEINSSIYAFITIMQTDSVSEVSDSCCYN